MINVLLLLTYGFWSVLVCNSLESLGGTSGVALQWSGRNSMVVPHLYGLVRIQGKVAS